MTSLLSLVSVVRFDNEVNDDCSQFVGDSLSSSIMTSLGRSEEILQDNDKMDRDEASLTYIQPQKEQPGDIRYTDLYVDGQDVYYDLPRYFKY